MFSPEIEGKQLSLYYGTELNPRTEDPGFKMTFWSRLNYIKFQVTIDP